MLPEKLHKLIDVALEDLRKVEAMPGVYAVDMKSYWHCTPYSKKVCVVCFAGSVMAMSLGVDRSQDHGPDAFPRYTRDRLKALNCIRSGYVSMAIKIVHNLNMSGPDEDDSDEEKMLYDAAAEAVEYFREGAFDAFPQYDDREKWEEGIIRIRDWLRERDL